ncbi:MAG: ABC transporter permease [Rhodobiaceae bacterium]|nr:ABC transporter permease [Rhodobiaceae bacterium]MCC0057311.1 ABC transporter permease [Rhodobiaceae bacterium]
MIVAVIAACGIALPFATFRANRIVAGEALSVLQALPAVQLAMFLVVVLIATGTVLLSKRLPYRLAAGCAGLLCVLVAMGVSATYLSPPESAAARVGPAAGFWLLVAAFALSLTDTLARWRLSPYRRLIALALAACVLAALLGSGLWGEVSILKEYAVRRDRFWEEAARHVALAFSSLAAAVVAGVPLGVVCYRVASVRQPLLNVLNIIQTIPSIALFGILIPPLAWLAANAPLASELGISGIGAAPALIALFGYALLPVVTNTLAGLNGVPEATRDAALGMGMTDGQKFLRVELPLAFPVILTGIRIVLVQNIGLATIAALIGGGGFGVFVFQGMGQTAIDLILLGALPTVFLSFAAAVVLDALVELSARRGNARSAA